MRPQWVTDPSNQLTFHAFRFTMSQKTIGFITEESSRGFMREPYA